MAAQAPQAAAAAGAGAAGVNDDAVGGDAAAAVYEVPPAEQPAQQFDPLVAIVQANESPYPRRHRTRSADTPGAGSSTQQLREELAALRGKVVALEHTVELQQYRQKERVRKMVKRFRQYEQRQQLVGASSSSGWSLKGAVLPLFGVSAVTAVAAGFASTYYNSSGLLVGAIGWQAQPQAVIPRSPMKVVGPGAAPSVLPIGFESANGDCVGLASADLCSVATAAAPAGGSVYGDEVTVTGTTNVLVSFLPTPTAPAATIPDVVTTAGPGNATEALLLPHQQVQQLPPGPVWAFTSTLFWNIVKAWLLLMGIGASAWASVKLYHRCARKKSGTNAQPATAPAAPAALEPLPVNVAGLAAIAEDSFTDSESDGGEGFSATPAKAVVYPPLPRSNGSTPASAAVSPAAVVRHDVLAQE
jgi:TolA-binding protein